MVTPDTVIDFLSCGTYLHEGSLLLTTVFYLWVGTYEETVKFVCAKLVKRWTEEPLFLSAMAFGILELLTRLFLYGHPLGWNLLAVCMHVLITRGSGKWWKATAFHFVWNLQLSLFTDGLLPVISLGIVAYSVYYFIVNFPGKKFHGSACS